MVACVPLTCGGIVIVDVTVPDTLVEYEVEVKFVTSVVIIGNSTTPTKINRNIPISTPRDIPFLSFASPPIFMALNPGRDGRRLPPALSVTLECKRAVPDSK